MLGEKIFLLCRALETLGRGGQGEEASVLEKLGSDDDDTAAVFKYK